MPIYILIQFYQYQFHYKHTVLQILTPIPKPINSLTETGTDVTVNPCTFSQTSGLYTILPISMPISMSIYAPFHQYRVLPILILLKPMLTRTNTNINLQIQNFTNATTATQFYGFQYLSKCRYKRSFTNISTQTNVDVSSVSLLTIQVTNVRIRDALILPCY